MPGLPTEIQHLFVAQGGVASRRQLCAAGWSAAAIDGAVASRRLVHVHRHHGVYALMPVPLLGVEARARAALLCHRADTVLVHRSAGHRLEIVATAPGRVHLASAAKVSEPVGVVLHRTLLRPDDVALVGGLPTTTPARTLLDLAVTMDERALVRTVAEAEFRHALSPDDVLATLRRGHPGSARLRAALAIHAPGHGTMHSTLERCFRRLLITHGIPLPLRQQRLGRWVVDCLWPDLRLVVELDGDQHARPGRAAVDAARDLWLRREGYDVRRYVWGQLTRDPDGVLADLAAAMAAADGRPPAGGELPPPGPGSE